MTRDSLQYWQPWRYFWQSRYAPLRDIESARGLAKMDTVVRLRASLSHPRVLWLFGWFSLAIALFVVLRYTLGCNSGCASWPFGGSLPLPDMPLWLDIALGLASPALLIFAGICRYGRSHERTMARIESKIEQFEKDLEEDRRKTDKNMLDLVRLKSECKYNHGED